MEGVAACLALERAATRPAEKVSTVGAIAADVADGDLVTFPRESRLRLLHGCYAPPRGIEGQGSERSAARLESGRRSRRRASRPCRTAHYESRRSPRQPLRAALVLRRVVR